MYDATSYPDWTLDHFVNMPIMAKEYRPNPDRFKLMQYTGLKDKNGKEIYEGDVIEAKHWAPMRYVVEFVEGGYCLTNPKIKHSPIDINLMYSSLGCACEVIGNIYEHSELLTK